MGFYDRLSWEYNLREALDALAKEENGAKLILSVNNELTYVYQDMSAGARKMSKQRYNHAAQYYADLKELAFYLGSGISPYNASYDLFAKFRPVIEQLVRTGVGKPEMLTTYERDLEAKRGQL